jgi:hypothetical protein
MAAKGLLQGCTAAEIQTIRAAALACIVNNTVRGTTYTIAGRSFSFPSIEGAQELLSECNYSLGFLQGTRALNLRANFNPSIGKGTGA